MTGDNLEDVLVEKGIPVETVDRINPRTYTSIMSENHNSINYAPDRVIRENYLDARYSDLNYVGIDLDGGKVCYYDAFNLPKLGYSEDDFETSVVLDSRDTAWIVDRVENNSYYFNTDSNEFLPNYNPEIVDPADFISRIWSETKRRARKGEEFAEATH